MFGVVQDKDYVRMTEELAGSGLFHRIAVAQMHTGRAAAPEKLGELLAGYPGCEYCVYENVSKAFRELLGSRGPGERLYIAGSLYLAGEIKEMLENDKF